MHGGTGWGRIHRGTGRRQVSTGTTAAGGPGADGGGHAHRDLPERPARQAGLRMRRFLIVLGMAVVLGVAIRVSARLVFGLLFYQEVFWQF